MTALLDALVTLAGTGDGDPAVEACLREIVALIPAMVGPVDSASITIARAGRYVTLATSDTLAADADAAQYSDSAGPCLQALNSQDPVAVPETAAGTDWPQFREKAMSAGLFAALSIPLYAGSGTTVASLNLYARGPAAMAGLILAVLALYRRQGPAVPGSEREQLHDGAEHLLDALAAALHVHDDIQHALGMLMTERGLSPAHAYTALRDLAHAHHSGLHAAALAHLTRTGT